jgi:HEAT repeat protein
MAAKPKKPKAEKVEKAPEAKGPPAPQLPGNLPKDLTDLLQKIPAKDFQDAVPVIKALVEKGPEAVVQLVGAVGDEFGDPLGVLPKYALHGMVHYASRPGMEPQRKMLAETLAKQLEARRSVELRAFLCRQLQLCGRPAEVGPLAKLLAEAELCEPAAQALCAIGGPEATDALREALPKAQGKQRATLLSALGRLRDPGAAQEARKSLADGEPDQRWVAWYAAANAGDAESAETLLKVAETTESPYLRSQAADACLRLARRLAELGKPAEAQKVLRQLAERRKDPADAHDRTAILEAFVQALGVKAAPDVLAALESDSLRLRHAAATIAVDLARSIRKEHPAEAQKVLEKVLVATKDEAVRQQAELLLGKHGK